MNPAALAALESRFAAYTDSFRPPAGALPYPLQLKLDHSRRVAADAAAIAQDLGWPAAEVTAGRAAGLLHDIARFPQYARFKTFSDADSFDHGEEGFAILTRERFLPDTEPERQALLDAVRYHNRREIPATLPPASRPLLHLIRDADKLDILHVINEFLRHENLDDYPEILLHTDLNGPPTPELVRELRERRTASYRNVHSLADINLMRVMWVYDINYLPTLRRMQERRLYDDLRANLPDDPQVQSLVNDALSWLRQRLRDPQPPTPALGETQAAGPR